MQRSSLFRIGLKRFLGSDEKPHCQLVDRFTQVPSVCGSIYEAYLSGHMRSHNSLYAELGHLAALLSFGVEKEIDIESRLLAGHPLNAQEIDGFSLWLVDRIESGGDGLSPSKVRTLNSRIRGARLATEWFINQYLNLDNAAIARSFAVEQVIQNSRRSWRGNLRRETFQASAPDLSDDAIHAIEGFLRDASSGRFANPMWVRAYLIWRLAMEFGFRIGEILGLRLEDCPNRTSPTFNIVRVEERVGAVDPRGVYAPRPKTLSRELAPILSHSVFPRLVVDYQADHRLYFLRTSAGNAVKRPILKHPYLLVSNSGEPLPTRSAANIAESISRQTGIPFHWHLARHAFFNRAYAAVAQIADQGAREVHIKDLVH